VFDPIGNCCSANPKRGACRILKSKSLAVLVGTVALGAVWALTAQPAKAGLWTASGSGSDGALDAEANITFSTGEMHVTLTNLLNPATIGSAGQSVSDLGITLGSSPGTNVEANTTAAGQLADIARGGAVTDVSGTPGRFVSSSTGGFAITGNTVLLEAIGHGQPTVGS
jgi:hypothetical protein